MSTRLSPRSPSTTAAPHSGRSGMPLRAVMAASSQAAALHLAASCPRAAFCSSAKLWLYQACEFGIFCFRRFIHTLHGTSCAGELLLCFIRVHHGRLCLALIIASGHCSWNVVAWALKLPTAAPPVLRIHPGSPGGASFVCAGRRKSETSKAAFYLYSHASLHLSFQFCPQRRRGYPCICA